MKWVRTAVLADLYRQTLPPDRKAMREREKHTESILLMLKNLAVAAESFIAVLERTGIYVYTEDGLLPIGLKSVLEPCEALARSSRYLIGVVRRPHTHKPNLVRQCVPLFVFLTKELKVTDEQALGLLEAALRAHVYDETALVPFQSPRSGTVRRRTAATAERILADDRDRVQRTGRYLRPAQPSKLTPNTSAVSPKTQKD
jgi:hypothetical protein